MLVDGEYGDGLLADSAAFVVRPFLTMVNSFVFLFMVRDS